MVGLATAETILLDACFLINLCASGHEQRMLDELPMVFAIADRVSGEALFVLPRRQDRGLAAPGPIDLERLVAGGLLTVLSLADEVEGRIFLAFAAELDDGEAMTCAIAEHRGYSVATDDRKAQRVLRERAPQTRVLGTTDLVRTWAEAVAINHLQLKQMLLDITERGRFVPRRDDENRQWWDSVLNA